MFTYGSSVLFFLGKVSGTKSSTSGIDSRAQLAPKAFGRRYGNLWEI